MSVCRYIATLRGAPKQMNPKQLKGNDVKLNFYTIGRSPRRAESGFTLLELLVVMVIIGLLAGYVGPKYFSQVGKSQVKTARAQFDALEKALDQYRLDTGRYPGMDQGLAALITRPPNEPKWDGPYLKKNVPADPWGNPYVYKIPGDHGEFDLVSLGKDGQVGGTGEAADITNW
jgi:general secretion pathway protein G